MSSLRLVVISIVLMSTIACGSNYSSSPSPSPSPAPAPAPAPASVPGTSSSPVTIPAGASTLGSRAYAPDSVDVAVGGTVTWTNSDSVAHTSTSDASGWDSGIVAPGGQFSVAFPTAGTFSYHCAIHPGMIGTVVVR
jgi:plastocyanin